MKNLVQQTQLEAYNSLSDLGAKQSAVYQTIKKLQEASDHDIADEMNVPINTVTPRRNELFRMGVIREARRDISKQTKKRVIFWAISNPNIQVAMYTKKKKGRYIHSVCGGQMKIDVSMHKTYPSNDMVIKKLLICECGQEETFHE